MFKYAILHSIAERACNMQRVKRGRLNRVACLLLHVEWNLVLSYPHLAQVIRYRPGHDEGVPSS